MAFGKVAASLVIPTYNKSSRLTVVLESLFHIRNSSGWELIIVNDGSTDDTKDLLDKFRKRCSLEGIEVSLVNTGNGGRSYARNIGLQKARGSVVIFTDDDLILHPDFIQAHLKRHEKDPNVVVHGQIYHIPYARFFQDPVAGTMEDGRKTSKSLMDRTIRLEMFESGRIREYLNKNARINRMEQDIKDLYLNTTQKDSCYRFVGFNGGNVSVRRENLIKAGMFDTQMGITWGCEDLELGYRLYKKGLNFVYDTQAKNYHMDHHRKDFKKIHEHSIKYFLKKHPDISIQLLSRYFNGELGSFLEWKNILKQQGWEGE